MPTDQYINYYIRICDRYVHATSAARILCVCACIYPMIDKCITSGNLVLSQHIAESIATDCRVFRLRRLLSTAYKIQNSVDKGLQSQNILQSVVIDSATYRLEMISFNDKVAMSLYSIKSVQTKSSNSD